MLRKVLTSVEECFNKTTRTKANSYSSNLVHVIVPTTALYVMGGRFDTKSQPTVTLMSKKLEKHLK